MTGLPSLTIGKHHVPYPIIQGGMGIRISGAQLAAAVANSGGIGVISAVGLGFNSPYFDPVNKKGDFFAANRLALIDELKLARSLSPNGVIGINSMVAARDHETLVQTAIAHGANLVIAGAGLPLSLPELTKDYPDVALVPIISSVRAAQVICRRWQRSGDRLPDAFIVENPNSAGGHLGAKKEEIESPEISTEVIIPALVQYLKEELVVPIPVIAAGGIWDRQDIDRALALGASGVQLGTRFITTEECDADRRYKEFHLHARSEDVMIVPSPVGLPGRALRNPFVEWAIATENQPSNGKEDLTRLYRRCVANCLQVCRSRDQQESYCIFQALDRAARGDVEHGLIFAGKNAGRADRILSVAELMAELTR